MARIREELVGSNDSDSGRSGLGVLDPILALGEPESGTCQLGTMANVDNSKFTRIETYPDSDESEMKRRKFGHKRMADPLKKLIKPEIEYLLSYLEYEMPQSVHILSFIKVLLKWKNTSEIKRKGFSYKILIPTEECGPAYPLIVAYYVWKGQIKGSMFASSYFGVKVFEEALQYSRYFPIKGEACEWCLHPIEVASTFMNYWGKMVDNGGYSPKYTAYPVHLYWIPEEDLADSPFLNMPREVKTEALNSTHVETVDYFWGRHHEKSSDLVQQMIFSNLSLGASTFNDDFVAWALQTHYGALDIIFTIPKYRNKGIGRSLLLNLSQMLEKQGFHPHVFAQRDNYTTTTFLKKSGFKFVHESIYFHVDPALEPELFPKPLDPPHLPN